MVVKTWETRCWPVNLSRSPWHEVGWDLDPRRRWNWDEQLNRSFCNWIWKKNWLGYGSSIFCGWGSILFWNPIGRHRHRCPCRLHCASLQSRHYATGPGRNIERRDGDQLGPEIHWPWRSKGVVLSQGGRGSRAQNEEIYKHDMNWYADGVWGSRHWSGLLKSLPHGTEPVWVIFHNFQLNRFGWTYWILGLTSICLAINRKSCKCVVVHFESSIFLLRDISTCSSCSTFMQLKFNLLSLYLL